MFAPSYASVRSATAADYEQCLHLDHSYETGRVWQLHVREHDGRININLQVVRLPHRLKVVYPHTREQLGHSWHTADAALVAEQDHLICGYTLLQLDRVEQVVWVSDMAVHKEQRRQGTGSHLLEKAQRWAQQQGARQMMFALQTRNHPAIEFCRKNGFTFCGYNETEFQSGDIVLYFATPIR